MSDSLGPHRLQHARLPCPSLSPRVCSNSCLLSQLVLPSKHLILCCSLLLLPSIFPSIKVFSSESALHIRWQKYWSFSFSNSPSTEYSGLISFRIDAESEAPILWPPGAKSWLIGNEPDAGKDWGQEEKRMTEDEMVGWHHWLNGHECEQALGQGSLMCWSPWVTESQIRLNNWTTTVWTQYTAASSCHPLTSPCPGLLREVFE